MGTLKSTDTLLYSSPAQILFGQMPQTPHRSFGSKGENTLILMTIGAYIATLQKLLSWPIFARVALKRPTLELL